MNYEQAINSAKKGIKMTRPHWHWVYMSASENHPEKLALFEEHDGHERGMFKPTRSDRKADDWAVMP